MIRRVRVSIVFSAVFFLAGLSFAQVDRSGLTGTVTDSSGRLLPQAHVTVVENATGLRRESSFGCQRQTTAFPELPVGIYTVTFEHQGFKKLEFVDVEQVIGRTRTLDATLQVAGGEERVEVSSASALMDRNTSAVTGLIEKTQADELPLNGRDWSALTAFVPGAIDTGGSNQRTVRFAGRGLDDSNFTYDGVDATNVVNQTQRPWVRLAIPLDAIAEFRVDSLMATAEEGATGGAQLDVSSPSGTNRFHGRLFEYLRNDVFDAPLASMGLQRRSSAAASPESVRRIGGRTYRARQDVLLSRFRSVSAELGLPGERRRAEPGAHSNSSEHLAGLWDHQRLPGSGSKNNSDALDASQRPGRPALRGL